MNINKTFKRKLFNYQIFQIDTFISKYLFILNNTRSKWFLLKHFDQQYFLSYCLNCSLEILIILKIFIPNPMCERKSWSTQEDQALKYLYQTKQVKKWSTVAKLMAQEFRLQGRNGKQCRQRYHNHLDSRITKQSWKPDQERTLINLHNSVGNRWAMIARELPGRTDNCVKNHFYSKIRKGIRKLNKIISEYFRRELKELKVLMVYKLIEIAEQRYRSNGKSSIQLQNKCYQIKNKILQFSFDDEPIVKSQSDLPERKNLIKDIAEFSKLLKIKNKKKKNKKKDIQLQEEELESKVLIQQEEQQSQFSRQIKQENIKQEIESHIVQEDQMDHQQFFNQIYKGTDLDLKKNHHHEEISSCFQSHSVLGEQNQLGFGLGEFLPNLFSPMNISLKDNPTTLQEYDYGQCNNHHQSSLFGFNSCWNDQFAKSFK